VLHLTLGTDIEVDVLLKMFHGNNRAIIFDFDRFVSDGGNVVDAFLE